MREQAYRFHTADLLVMGDGGKLTWQVGTKGDTESHTKCGNPVQRGMRDILPLARPSTTSSIKRQSAPVEAAPGHKGPPPNHRVLSAVNVTTYSWIYVFP